MIGMKFEIYGEQYIVLENRESSWGLSGDQWVSKDWLADRLRDSLYEQGFNLISTPNNSNPFRRRVNI